MYQKLLFAGVVASALVGGGDAARSEAVTADGDGVRRFTLIAPDTEQTNFDVGRRGPSQGDLFIFSGPLRGPRGVTRGRLDGHCVTVSTPSRTDREQDRRQCFITSTLGTANGETEIQATGVGRILSEDVSLSVTGGTGRFKRVSGQALFDYRTRGQVTINYELYLEP